MKFESYFENKKTCVKQFFLSLNYFDSQLHCLSNKFNSFPSDPRSLPKSARDGSLGPNVAPPVFTHDTLSAKRTSVKSAGQTFRASCEALGSPRPEIFWFKDGEHISESVRHDGHGRSTVEFSVLGPADGGVYTCRASNMLGERTVDFALRVRQQGRGAGGSGAPAQGAVVVEVGPKEVRAAEGRTVALRCRVTQAQVEPHVKWLKRLDPVAAPALLSSPPNSVGGFRGGGGDGSALSVGQERYRILEGNSEVEIGEREYLSTLEIPSVSKEDAGMYICFVTNSGFVKFTYVSMNLVVLDGAAGADLPSSVDEGPLIPTDHQEGGEDEESLPMLVLAGCLAAVVAVLLVCIGVVACKKQRDRSNGKKAPLPTSSSSSSSSSPDSPDVQRPFISATASSGVVIPHTNKPAANNNTYHLPHGNNNNGTLVSSSTASARSRSQQQQQQQQHPWLSGGRSLVYPAASSDYKQPNCDSGFDSASAAHKTLLDSTLNQYEVPYSHLLIPPPPGPAAAANRSDGPAAAAPYAFRRVYHHPQHQPQQPRSLSDRVSPPAYYVGSGGGSGRRQQQNYNLSDYGSQ